MVFTVALKKIALSDQQILGAITTLDISTLGTEYVDLLANVVPNEQEVKAFNNYEAGGKPLEALSLTDRFMIRVSWPNWCDYIPNLDPSQLSLCCTVLDSITSTRPISLTT